MNGCRLHLTSLHASGRLSPSHFLSNPLDLLLRLLRCSKSWSRPSSGFPFPFNCPTPCGLGSASCSFFSLLAATPMLLYSRCHPPFSVYDRSSSTSSSWSHNWCYPCLLSFEIPNCWSVVAIYSSNSPYNGCWIDRPKLVPQLLCNRTIQCSNIFKF